MDSARINTTAATTSSRNDRSLMHLWVFVVILVVQAPICVTGLVSPRHTFRIGRTIALHNQKQTTPPPPRPPTTSGTPSTNNFFLFDTDANFRQEEQQQLKQQQVLLQSSGLLSTVLMPAAKALNEATGGYALTYADCSPESEKTIIGQVFLATNLAYAVMGLVCLYYGDAWFGTITEAASVASFTYHYNQLSNPKDAAFVRLVLTIDYIIAFGCMGTAMTYLLTDPMAIPFEAYIACALSLLFLGFSWIWEAGAAYCFHHGLWHLFGAYGGYLIGQSHALVTGHP